MHEHGEQEQKLTEEERKHAEECINNIIHRIEVMMRLGSLDNGITPPTNEEILICIEDSLNEINAFPPVTNLKLDYFFTDQGKSQVTMLCWGAIKNIYTILLADVAANSIDVSIDEFQISSRLNEFQMLKNEYEQKFLNDLQARKSQMGVVFRGQYRQTSSYGWDGTVSTNMARRYYKTIFTV